MQDMNTIIVFESSPKTKFRDNWTMALLIGELSFASHYRERMLN